MFVQNDENKRKRGWGWPIFEKIEFRIRGRTEQDKQDNHRKQSS